jgi:hypothetical protein
MSRLVELVGPFLDLVTAPFSLPGSRLLVLREGDGLTVRRAEYERSLDECIEVQSLRIVDASGETVLVSAVFPDRIELDGVSLTFAGSDGVSIGATGLGSWQVEFVLSGSVQPLVFSIDAERSVLVAVGEVPRAASSHASHLASVAALWESWFERCPRVRQDLQPMAAFCWWVLGINTVTLAGHQDSRVVVPSKIGYVGLWQWDAYFIAAGLRHGDPELAREQLDIAFRFPTAEGQLPDVVHDGGVLASSDDLPQADRDKLLRDGSSIARPDAVIPLTKPPLAAWALTRVLEFVDDAAWADAAWVTVAGSQEWWFAHSDLDGDGMPEYGHPYSSGLDDSPIFDHALPIPSPDLAAYLIVQDDLLAERASLKGDTVDAARHRERAERTLALLETSWDDATGFYRAGSPRHLQDEYTVVSLLPLLTGRLSSERVERIVAALADPALFATPYAVPTVARSDARFSADTMWRGPVWININAMLVEGLRKSGHPDLARELAERTVQLVIHGGGPHEYFNPFTGGKASHATSAFGWSAALFIDLAVGLS